MKSNIKNDHMKDIIVVWRALARSYQLWYLTFLSKYLIMKVHKHGFQSSINAGRYQFTSRLISCFSQFLIRKWENIIRGNRIEHIKEGTVDNTAEKCTMEMVREMPRSAHFPIIDQKSIMVSDERRLWL